MNNSQTAVVCCVGLNELSHTGVCVCVCIPNFRSPSFISVGQIKHSEKLKAVIPLQTYLSTILLRLYLTTKTRTSPQPITAVGDTRRQHSTTCNHRLLQNSIHTNMSHKKTDRSSWCTGQSICCCVGRNVHGAVICTQQLKAMYINDKPVH